MGDLYSIHPGIPWSPEAVVELHKDPLFYSSDAAPEGHQQSNTHVNGRVPVKLTDRFSTCSDLSDLMKAKIAGHPRYPALVSAYIDCRKVGAPPEVAYLLEGIRREGDRSTTRSEIGADPELDEFMESYCQALLRYKEELARPFDEAASFLHSMDTQLSDLCKATAGAATSNSAAGTPAICSSPSEERGGSTDEHSCGDLDAKLESQDGGGLGEQELKDMLLRRYSGYLGSLRKEFLKKRKKGKLPKSARSTLLDWWNTHYRWPYPTEEEKASLGQMTGLDQKQINNWFINQRKRHWKPSDDMRTTLLEGVAAGSSTTATWYFDTRTIGP